MNLFKASNQWAQRPDDERFESVADLNAACAGYRADARTATVPYKTLLVEPGDGNMLLRGQTGEAVLSNWAFGQLCARVSAPAGYLRTLPPSIAASALNVGLTEGRHQVYQKDEDNAVLLLHKNGSYICRGMTSPKYTRIWNSDITSRLLDLEPLGWRVPPARPCRKGQTGARPATAEDVLRYADMRGLSVQIGDMIAPAGLYASDHDLFAFMINEDSILDGGNEEYLNRGFFVWNSEVGAASFGIMTFLFDRVCGNHIVWGARGVKELRIPHMGAADQRAFKELSAELRTYADDSAREDEARIASAKSFVLGADKDEVLDRVFGLRVPVLSRKLIGAAYALAEQFEDVHGAPNTAWGMASGLTRYSQTTPYADQRVALDRAAGRVLEVAF